MNNKGVTTVELLIVIVVMGIIAAFSITAVSQILENTKQGAFVTNANTILTSAKMSYMQGDDIWDDNSITLGELIESGYIEITTSDPWGGLYDLNESYVLAEVTLVSSGQITLSLNTFSLVESTTFKIKLVSTTATIGYDEALEEFSREDIVFEDGSSSIFESIIQMFNNNLEDDYTTDNGDDEVNIEEDISNDASVNLEGGNDTLNIGDDVKNGSTVNMGDGDDIINMDGELTGSSSIDTGDGNDTINIGDDIQDDSVVTTGAGDDTVVVDDDLQDGALLDTGSGDDTVTLKDELDKGTIKTGEGDDTVTIDRIRSTSYIDTGEGNDSLLIDDVSSTFDNGSVTMGPGNDTLTLRDSMRGSRGTWDGGEGNDVLNLPDVSLSKWNESVSIYFSGFETINLKDHTINTN